MSLPMDDGTLAILRGQFEAAHDAQLWKVTRGTSDSGSGNEKAAYGTVTDGAGVTCHATPISGQERLANAKYGVREAYKVFYQQGDFRLVANDEVAINLPTSTSFTGATVTDAPVFEVVDTAPFRPGRDIEMWATVVRAEGSPTVALVTTP